MAIGLIVTKNIGGKVWVMAYAYRQVCVCKSNDRILDTKINLMDSIHSFAYILVDV